MLWVLGVAEEFHYGSLVLSNVLKVFATSREAWKQKHFCSSVGLAGPFETISKDSITFHIAAILAQGLLVQSITALSSLDPLARGGLQAWWLVQSSSPRELLSKCRLLKQKDDEVIKVNRDSTNVILLQGNRKFVLKVHPDNGGHDAGNATTSNGEGPVTGLWMLAVLP